MSKFHYIIHATQSDNVGEIEAKDDKDALSQLKDIYAPDNPTTGKAHKGVSFELIDKSKHDAEKVRIEAARKKEAELTVSDDTDSTSP